MKKIIFLLIAVFSTVVLFAATKYYKKTHAVGNCKFAILQTLTQEGSGIKITVYNKKGKKLAAVEDKLDEEGAESSGMIAAIMKTFAMQSEGGGVENYQILVVFALGRAATVITGVNYNSRANEFRTLDVQDLSESFTQGRRYAEVFNVKNSTLFREVTFFTEDDPTCCPSGEKKIIEYQFETGQGNVSWLKGTPKFVEVTPPDDQEDGSDTE